MPLLVAICVVAAPSLALGIALFDYRRICRRDELKVRCPLGKQRVGFVAFHYSTERNDP